MTRHALHAWRIRTVVLQGVLKLEPTSSTALTNKFFLLPLTQCVTTVLLSSTNFFCQDIDSQV